MGTSTEYHPPAHDPIAQPSVVLRSEPHSLLTFIAAGALLLVAGSTIWASLGLGLWVRLGPGPGFFPLCLGILLTVCVVGWLVQHIRGRVPAEVAPDDTSSADAASEPAAAEAEHFNARLAVTIVASLVALAALMEVLGYQLSMLAFLLFHLKVLGRRGWLLSIALSVAGGVGVFVVFTRLLGVYLPASSIGVLAQFGF